jgi:NADH:ubiquinone oxidoreductase subunit E
LTAVPRFAHGSRVPGWDDAVDLEKSPAEVPEPATTVVPDDLRAAIERHMRKYPDRRSAVIPALHEAQDRYGWCSPEAIEQVAVVMALTPGYLTAIATFYDMFSTTPVGRHTVYVCTNISCSLRGADALLEAMLGAADDDPDFNVRAFECLGACDIAPMASVNGEYVGPLDDSDAATIVADLRAGRPVLESKQLRRRPVADPGARRDGSSGNGGAPEQWGRREEEPQADTAGLGEGGETEDRAGPAAPIELNQQEEEGSEDGE